ncbi:hypothetical protein [Cohnella rhizosphaerae]|uniref:Uncharacterized protein n=1 Tax=Cohnella rhizosphaerae TaxID=1457232 RepID=A0A9X4QTS9_9BACL|nr:hypothetical protein [Cohnella rhizosphaerae]MDG0810703.1 hypothetical protein [Cohnella rhizosphaerae]
MDCWVSSKFAQEAGAVRTMTGETRSPINAGNLRKTHLMLETCRTAGKVVLEGF